MFIMAKNFKSETKLSIKNAPKRLTFKGNGKPNEWIASFFFILVLVPVNADIKFHMDHVARQQSSDDFLRFEIIKPTLQHSRNRSVIFDTRLEDGSHANELILRYIKGGKDVILDLKLNENLIPHNHFMRYQLPNGTDAVHHFTKTDVDLCHYRGTIRNNSESYVAISTCYGIKGMIFDGNETYYIDTKNSGNVNDEHYLFRHSDWKQNESNNPSCGLENHENEAMEPPTFNEDPVIRKYKRSIDGLIRGPSNANGQSSFVELVLVVDHSIYRNFGRDFKKIHHYCKDIANVVNARDVLMHEHPNDNAHLLTNQKFDRSVIGHAIVNSICTYQSSGGITNNHSQRTSVVASTVAHELGHNFGMWHDNNGCKCEKEPCVMAQTNSNQPAYAWSSCSKDKLNLAFHRGLLQCLRNKPTELVNSAECGNGFVEPGEQCDCGLAECDNSCCDATTCQLHQNATCATGECCDLTSCRLRAIGTQCRPSVGECDIPEHCNGESEYCPENNFKRDTELCGGGKAYCYEGACQSHTDQCKLLWGEKGKSVHQCYGNNLNGNAWGNCGKNWMENTLKKCTEEDMMCGQVQCEPTNGNGLERNSRVQLMRGYSPVYPYFHCQVSIIDVGLYNVDPGLSPNGAKCGDGKMCIQQKCLSIDGLRASGIGVDCPGNCSGHGACDNKGQCHCDNGYLPPLCDINGPATSLNDGLRFVRMYILLISVVPLFFTLSS